MDARALRCGCALGLVCALALAACAPTIDSAGPPIQAPELRAETPAPPHVDEIFVASDGARLPVERWLPKEKPKAVILALHGMDDYANAFALPGPWWAAHGIATYAYDQRGFGRAPHPGIWAGTESMDADFDAFAALLHRRYPGTPLFALGESMGGAVVMTALAARDHPKVAGIILAAPAVWGRSTMDLGKRVALWLAVHTVPGLEVTGRGLNIVPSDNEKMLIALGRDPLVLKSTRIDAIWGVVNLMDKALADSSKLDAAPLLILYGERDQIIPRAPTREMIARLPKGDRVTVALYPHGYHMVLRDLEAKTVWNDVLHWIDDRDAPLPSGADKIGAKEFGGR